MKGDHSEIPTVVASTLPKRMFERLAIMLCIWTVRGSKQEPGYRVFCEFLVPPEMCLLFSEIRMRFATLLFTVHVAFRRYGLYSCCHLRPALLNKPQLNKKYPLSFPLKV